MKDKLQTDSSKAVLQSLTDSKIYEEASIDEDIKGNVFFSRNHNESQT